MLSVSTALLITAHHCSSLPSVLRFLISFNQVLFHFTPMYLSFSLFFHWWQCPSLCLLFLSPFLFHLFIILTLGFVRNSNRPRILILEPPKKRLSTGYEKRNGADIVGAACSANHFLCQLEITTLSSSHSTVLRCLGQYWALLAETWVLVIRGPSRGV